MSCSHFNLDEVRRASLECAVYHVLYCKMPISVGAALVSVSEQELVFAIRTFDPSQHARFRTHMFRKQKGWIATDLRVYLDAAVYHVVCHDKVCNNMAHVFNIPPTTLRRYVSITKNQLPGNKEQNTPGTTNALGQSTSKTKCKTNQQPKKTKRNSSSSNNNNNNNSINGEHAHNAHDALADVSKRGRWFDRISSNSSSHQEEEKSNKVLGRGEESTTFAGSGPCCTGPCCADTSCAGTVGSTTNSNEASDDSCINWDSFPELNDDVVLYGTFGDNSAVTDFDQEFIVDNNDFNLESIVDNCCESSDWSSSLDAPHVQRYLCHDGP